MTVEYVAASENSGTGSNITTPYTGVNEGQLGLVFTQSTGVVTGPGAWTPLGSATLGSTILSAFGKVFSGTESGNWLGTTPGPAPWVVVMFQMTCTSGNRLNLASFSQFLTSTQATTGVIATPTYTTAIAGQMLWSAASSASSNGAPLTISSVNWTLQLARRNTVNTPFPAMLACNRVNTGAQVNNQTLSGVNEAALASVFIRVTDFPAAAGLFVGNNA